MKIETDPKRGGKTVLIVEPNATIRQMIADAFLSDGFRTGGEAANGKEGIEVAKRCSPDVIVLELSMPVLNGLEAGSQLRKLFRKIPIILCTLYNHHVLDDVASEAGINLVLPKTVALSTLVEKVHSLMGD